MMKSLSLKKITSSSIAFLTAISSLIGLNSAKVAAMPGAFEHQIRIPSKIIENVIFTIEDMNNLIRNIDRLPRTTAIARTPNFKNLTKVDPNVNHWLGAVQVYLDITEEIIDENLDENLTEEEIEEVMDSGKIDELTAVSSKIGVSEYRQDLLDEYVLNVLKIVDGVMGENKT